MIHVFRQILSHYYRNPIYIVRHDNSLNQTIQRTKMIAATTCSFKPGIIVEIVFHVVTIVEVITYNVAIFLDNKVATIGIITAFPFLGWCHAESELTDTNQRLSKKRRECRKGTDGEVVLTA